MDELMQNATETKDVILTNRLEVLLAMAYRKFKEPCERTDEEIGQEVRWFMQNTMTRAQISLIKELLK